MYQFNNITNDQNRRTMQMRMTPASACIPTTITGGDEEKTLQKELYLLILLADQVIKSAANVDPSKGDHCSELVKKVDRLSHMLCAAVRFSVATPSLYDRPLRCVSDDITKNLDRTLAFVRKCKHSGFLRQVFSMTTTADFRKVSSLLESSMADMKWLLAIFESEGVPLSLPPIACNDPILAWVWAYISTLHMGQLKDRVDAANELASLAGDNDRNKKMIVEEGGISPLLKLLKENDSPEAQIAAATALFNVGTDQERVKLIVDALAIPMIVGVLVDSPVRVQIVVVKLVAKMAELDLYAQEEFVRRNVTRPLVSPLSADLVWNVDSNRSVKSSVDSDVELNKELTFEKNNSSNGGSYHSDASSSHRKERETEAPEARHMLKVCCGEALWKLSKGSVTNSRKITETRGLLCLAKMIEKEKGELQFNCLMAVMEITVVAEVNADLRRAAFKTNSPAAKAVVDQLLRVVQQESDPELQIPAIISIGCLARTFPARETRIILPLVSQLGSRNVDVATESAVALGKFVCLDNYNRSQHSRAIIEFGGVKALMKLLRAGDSAQLHGLELLCYLALSAGNSKVLEQARALHTLEGAARQVVAQHPQMKDLFLDAIHHLTLYQAGAHPHRLPLSL
ncbi:hypothetical protein K2173_028600 [Erythroxylum novogranatense]|uniref:DUF7792 domain-containing protein n=1 Tax=Erythroxylum novogranatense TaxID=1862640 RepID=A0AAV8U559_9ROSI|nr:hypothetical protein K2173_028600 [Erythroxylum novogranatense]